MAASKRKLNPNTPQMKHSAESYAALGDKAGKAVRHRDQSMFYRHEMYLRQWLAQESEEDRSFARKMFDKGYRGELLTIEELAR